ncbi:glycine--tRNA ligase subunit beta [Candidatus Erwinia haradaeae]|uniref:Glycine--tRNA ligase beta subunit n=1 Tax=Candidatus Erwinia haradaeae TaxID=1922217 RepID=A0A451DGN0_9GAMM|nr:glycine--tRNA ligase subunit beta [Candidatus Erwinia haradaeae]VFP85785.1 Glycine--tRNA ligase beta subunit [Candidatus Erwinia haradaeae]
MTKENFLVEIGTEELPPKILRYLAETFAKNVISELKAASLTYQEIRWFATPRRLALFVHELSLMQPDRKIIKYGPTIKTAFNKNGTPTQAAVSWAHSCDIDIEHANYVETKKGQRLMFCTKQSGQKTAYLLPEIISTSIKKLTNLKHMRWGQSNFYFIRPVHTVMLILGDTLIPINIFGISSSRIIQGHRFMGQSSLTIDHADHYLQVLLKKGKVQVDYFLRKKIITTNATDTAARIGGLVDLQEKLLEEVTALVEWPVILMAKFDKKFLTIPTEALVHTMVDHQKYFPIYNQKGALLPYFIFVSNIESSDPQKIISGNEKVIQARLEDAAFFFHKDCQHLLDDYLPRLQNVLFQKSLGNLLDKTYRIKKLSEWVAEKINSNVQNAKRAGLLSKCDLMTHMVRELTETQGIMGMHYARRQGESEEVAIALMEQYKPRFSGDSIPSNPTSYALAIADKIDTIVGIFGISQHPTGDKDPFALRRSALGILRIILEKKLPIDLQSLTEESIKLYDKKLSNTNVVEDIINFFFGRLSSWYQEIGYKTDAIKAVLVCRPTKPINFHTRIEAVTYFCAMKHSTRLSAAHKRISSILNQSEKMLNHNVHYSLLYEKEEIQLATRIKTIKTSLDLFLLEERYQDALIALTPLHKDIEEFFSKVLVNTKIKELRINRLTLLNQLKNLFLQIADLSLLE